MRRPALPLVALALLLSFAPLRAEEPPNGPRRVGPGWYALTGATVHPAPGETLRATVVIRNGRVVAVGDEVPPGARVLELPGHHVYPAFLDAYVPVPAPRPPQGAPRAHWNRMVTPNRTPLDGVGLGEETARKLRELGFGAALLAPEDGVVRGDAALVSLRARDPRPGSPRPPVYESAALTAAAFDTVRDEEGGYPDSLMGAIALLRQCLADGLLPDRPLLLVATDELNVLRAARVAREFRRRAVIVGAGTEFRRREAIRRLDFPLVVPLSFPKKPDVRSIGAAEAVSLRQLLTWEQAPTNPRRLAAASLTVALTTNGLEDRSLFLDRLRLAIRHGLTEEAALAMLTANPARMLGVEGRLGTIRPGAVANLQVTDGPVFGEHTRIRWLFVDGVPEEIRPASLAGQWSLKTDPPVPDPVTLVFDHRDGLRILSGGEESEAELTVEGDRVDFSFDHRPFGDPGHFLLTGYRDGETLEGDGVRSDGRRFRWTARRVSREVPRRGDEPAEDRGPPDVPESYGTPLGAYGTEGIPERPPVLIVRGATLWTCGPAGVVPDGVLIVRDGKIVFAGERGDGNLPDGQVIDARGKHVTPGLIDCHSHTGISGGVNESGQAVTAEVRVEDVLDPDDVNFYRQLAGGLTVANLLHGSANPIGGQSATVKLRWGVADPDEMLLEGAKPGIKFALGENVKQSNWDLRERTRYPQTRMGVETLIRDRLAAAREYAAARARGEPVRRDLELEALAEVLAGTRLVHCHAYRQDEILMLCHVARDFGFRIGTFQHVLEGYKVAEALREWSGGASCFSDWWAYKVEVQDAIPENGPILHEAGVVVSYNSDSPDLARRLNTEAAKAVKYGGLPPEEALNFVTIHPARQLGIEDRLGSLEPGKDADFVIWSGPPLDLLSRCERTYIDGREYFSLERHERHRAFVRSERLRLIQKVLAAKDEAEGREKGHRGKPGYRCTDEVRGGGR